MPFDQSAEACFPLSPDAKALNAELKNIKHELPADVLNDLDIMLSILRHEGCAELTVEKFAAALKVLQIDSGKIKDFKGTVGIIKNYVVNGVVPPPPTPAPTLPPEPPKKTKGTPAQHPKPAAGPAKPKAEKPPAPPKADPLDGLRHEMKQYGIEDGSIIELALPILQKIKERYPMPPNAVVLLPEQAGKLQADKARFFDFVKNHPQEFARSLSLVDKHALTFFYAANQNAQGEEKPFNDYADQRTRFCACLKNKLAMEFFMQHKSELKSTLLYFGARADKWKALVDFVSGDAGRKARVDSLIENNILTASDVLDPPRLAAMLKFPDEQLKIIKDYELPEGFCDKATFDKCRRIFDQFVVSPAFQKFIELPEGQRNALILFSDKPQHVKVRENLGFVALRGSPS